jgi:hypothetical protein
MSQILKAVRSPPRKRGSADVHKQLPRRWPTLQGAARHAEFLAAAADAEHRDCSFPGAEGEARSFARKSNQTIAMPRVQPNRSLKRSANGRPPGPVWRYTVHFRQPEPGVLPLSPA